VLVKRLGRQRFEGAPDAPRQARWWLAELLRRNGLQHELHDVMVMVSELATNAVKHTGGGFEIGAWSDGTDLRVEVVDADPNVPQVQWVPAGATSGRGLLIVETLSDAWGVSAREGGGKAVWFELHTSRN
jgi:anti-sigma regulatory factor (Ser/Thr protein kinase)